MLIEANVGWLDCDGIDLGDGGEGSDHRLWWHIPRMRNVPEGEPDEVISGQNALSVPPETKNLHDQNTSRRGACPEKSEWGTTSSASSDCSPTCISSRKGPRLTAANFPQQTNLKHPPG